MAPSGDGLPDSCDRKPRQRPPYGQVGNQDFKQAAPGEIGQDDERQGNAAWAIFKTAILRKRSNICSRPVELSATRLASTIRRRSQTRGRLPVFGR